MKYKNVKWLRFIQIAILVSCILILGLFSCLKLSEFLHPTKYIVSSENIIVVKIPYKKDILFSLIYRESGSILILSPEHNHLPLELKIYFSNSLRTSALFFLIFSLSHISSSVIHLYRIPSTIKVDCFMCSGNCSILT